MTPAKPEVPPRGPTGRSAARLNLGERGSAVVMVAAGALFLCLLGAAAVLVAGYAVAAQAAREAADLAALSGARAFALGGDACGVAGRVAAANRSLLRTCSIRGDSFSFSVTVAVSVAVPASWPGLPHEAAAEAKAGRRG